MACILDHDHSIDEKKTECTACKCRRFHEICIHSGGKK